MFKVKLKSSGVRTTGNKDFVKEEEQKKDKYKNSWSLDAFTVDKGPHESYPPK